MTFPASARARFLLVLFGFAILVGIGARVSHLDRKLFWEDEAMTALRVSGHDTAHFAQLYDGKVHPVSAVLAFVRLDPASNLGTVVATLARDDPHHAPLFYLLDRIALDAARPGSASVYRSPSVVFGILAIVFAYTFGLSFFRSKLGGAVMAALVAVSPLHILYSRQAREYALLTCVVLASSTLVIRALERKSPWAWLFYAISVAIGIYTDSIFVLVVAAHAVYAVVVARKHLPKLGAFAIAALAGLATFAPWILNGLNSHDSIGDQLAWGVTVFPAKFFAEKWAFNISAVFFDVEFADLRLAFVSVVILAIVLAAAYVTARRTDVATRTFAFALTLFPIGAFVALDALHGSHFSTIPRYLTAGWIGLEIVVASAFVRGLAAHDRRATVAITVVLLAGMVSAAYDNTQENWWDNNDQVAYQTVARTIGATPHPLLLVNGYYELPLLLSPYLKPDVSFLMFHPDHIPAIPNGTQHAFLLLPPPDILSAFVARNRPRFKVSNASPGVTNVITNFHNQLESDTTFKKLKQPARVQRFDNALWSFVPR